MSAIALHGGKPAVSPSIAKVAWPIITDTDRKAVNRVLDRKVLWAMSRPDGPYGPEQVELEREFGDFLGVKHVLAVNGGTAGLHMALVAAGVQAGDEVITPAFSFLATPAAILHTAAIPVFVDVHPRTWNLDPKLLEAKITPRTKAIFPVDIHGLCADWDPILAIAKRHNLVVVEDACQAPGATYHGRKAGSFGLTAGFSVNGTKNFGVGEGGFMVTNDDEAYYRANWVKQVGEVMPDSNRTMHYQPLLAWNYRTQELPCALARTQLTRLVEANATAQRNAAILAGYLKSMPGVHAPYIPDGSVSIYHKYRISLVAEELDTPLRGAALRDTFMAALAAEGVDVDRWGSAPLCAHPMVASRHGFGRNFPWSLAGDPQQYDYDPTHYPVTQALFENTFCVTNEDHPIYAQSETLMHAYGEALQKVAKHASELALAVTAAR